MKRVLSWLVGIAIWGLRLTCRYRSHNDRRAEIRATTGRPYVYAILHAHQVAAAMYGERGIGAMVSRSRDGEIIVPTLRLCGKKPVRGSSGGPSKGGATALYNLIQHLKQGEPAVIAVDGPRGPRNQVQKGAGFLAQKTNLPLLPVIVIPRRRWVLNTTWDRMQIPKPFTRVDVYFGDPFYIGAEEDLDAAALRLQEALSQLEQQYDPHESTSAGSVTDCEPVRQWQCPPRAA